MTMTWFSSIVIAASSFCFSSALLAESECEQLVKNDATDFHTKSRRRNDYHWKSSTDFSMNFRGGCRSSDFHVSHSGYGKATMVSTSFLDLDTKGGVMKGGDPWNRKDAMFFGYKIHGFKKSGTSVKTDENFKEFQFFDIGYTYGVDLGPFDVGVSVGIAGEAYLTGEYKYKFGNNETALSFFPGLDIYGYAKVGADVVIAEVSIGGELSFVKEELIAELSISYESGDNGEMKLVSEMSVTNELEMLSGKLFAKAEALGAKWEHKFIEWWGFKYKQPIWNSTDGFVIRDAFTRQSLPDVLMPGMPTPPPAS